MKTGSYEALLNDLETCSKGAPCAECKQPKKWNCDWMLMERAKKAVEELLTMHLLDQGEIVRLRRQIEVLKMGEYEKLADLLEGNRAPYKMEKETEADRAWAKVLDRLQKEEL